MRIIIHSICLSMFIAAVPAGRAFAADGAGDLDITIRMMDARQTADEFINRIELPKDFRGTDDKRKHRDGAKNNEEHRDGYKAKRSDTRSDRPSTDDVGIKDPSGTRDRVDESRERYKNFQENSREQQESLHHETHED